MAISTYRHILRRHNPEHPQPTGSNTSQLESSRQSDGSMSKSDNSVGNSTAAANMNNMRTEKTGTHQRLGPKLSPKFTSMLMAKQPFKQMSPDKSDVTNSSNKNSNDSNISNQVDSITPDAAAVSDNSSSTPSSQGTIPTTVTTAGVVANNISPKSSSTTPNVNASQTKKIHLNSKNNCTNNTSSTRDGQSISPNSLAAAEGHHEHHHFHKNHQHHHHHHHQHINNNQINKISNETNANTISNTNKHGLLASSNTANNINGPGSTMHVVIIGGSFSGLSVAVTLAKNQPKDRTRITLVEPKSYLEVRWATIRSLFDDSVCDASTVPLSKILSEHSSMISHVRALATAVALDTVTLEDGRQLPYDVLLVATGAVTAFSPLTPHLTPGTSLPPADALARRRAFLRDTGESILSARSVAIVGGGPVGTELAADIASFAAKNGRDTRVTLIDAHDKLMPGYPRSIAQKLRDKLSTLRVRVVLGQHAVQCSDGSWELRSSTSSSSITSSQPGKKLEADVVLKATGVQPCASQIFGEGSESMRDGWIRTDRFGRVVGCRGDVFAAGDCCDWVAKSGENTLANRNAYAHNIRLTVEAIANNRALASIDSRLKRVSVSHRPPAVVASTPRDGETVSPFAALSPAWWWMKNRGMLLAKAQKEIGW